MSYDPAARYKAGRKAVRIKREHLIPDAKRYLATRSKEDLIDKLLIRANEKTILEWAEGKTDE